MRTEVGAATEGEIAVTEFLHHYGSHVCASRYETCHEPGVHIIPKGDPFAPLTPHEQRLEEQRGRKLHYQAWRANMEAARKRANLNARGK